MLLVRSYTGKKRVGKTRNNQKGLSMAKKKEGKKEKKEEDFDINAEFKKLNPFLLNGFKKFIYEIKKADVKTKKEFDKLLKEYGG